MQVPFNLHFKIIERATLKIKSAFCFNNLKSKCHHSAGIAYPRGREGDRKRETKQVSQTGVKNPVSTLCSRLVATWKSKPNTLFHKEFLKCAQPIHSPATSICTQSTYKSLERKELEVVFY